MTKVVNSEMYREFKQLKLKQRKELEGFRNKWNVRNKDLYKKMNGKYRKDNKRRTEIRERLVEEQEGICAICEEFLG